MEALYGFVDTEQLALLDKATGVYFDGIIVTFKVYAMGTVDGIERRFSYDDSFGPIL